MKNSNFWQNVDGICLINLDQRKDRLISALEQLKTLAPSEKVSRVAAIDGKKINGFGEKPWFKNGKKDQKWAGRAGCTLSHRKALELAVARKWKTMLVLEDDFLCLNKDDILWASLTDEIFYNNKEWNIMYLGFTTPSGPVREISKINQDRSLFQIQGAKTTHAYLVKLNFAEWLLNKLPIEENVWQWCSRKRVIDRWYSRNLSKRGSVYCVSPSLFVQSDFKSDIVDARNGVSENQDFIWEIPHYLQTQSFYSLRKISFNAKSWLIEMLESTGGYLKRFIGF